MLSREWRRSWSSADRQCSNYIWMINKFIAYQDVSYIRVWGYLCFVKKFIKCIWKLYSPIVSHLPQCVVPKLNINDNVTNLFDARDRIFWLWGSISGLLMHWLLKSPVHKQAWYWLCRTDNMYYCFRLNSHIRHSRAGRALLRWRKECGRLWVLLGSAVQAPIHSSMCIESY